MPVAIGLFAGGCANREVLPTSDSAPGNVLTIYSSEVLHGPSSLQGKAVVRSARLALKLRNGRAGKFQVRLISLADSSPTAAAAVLSIARRNAERAANDRTTIAYIGDTNSGITKVTLPITNRAGILHASATNTYVGLTSGALGSEAGEPDRYYPSGDRTYIRVVPNDLVQAAALARVALGRGCRRIEIWYARSTYSSGLARNLMLAASERDLVVGHMRRMPPLDQLRRQVRRLHEPCFVFTGEPQDGGLRLLREVGRLRPKVKVFVSDGMVLNAIADPRTGIPKSMASRVLGTAPAIAPESLGARGRAFLRRFEREYDGGAPDPYAVYAFEAMNIVLDAIERAGDQGNSRSRVIEEAFDTKVFNGLLGEYEIDDKGDTTLTDYGVYRIRDGRLQFDRVIRADDE